jgi:hypothetical protein
VNAGPLAHEALSNVPYCVVPLHDRPDGSVLVVHEGAPRLAWAGSVRSPDHRLIGLWPHPQEADGVLAHLEGGGLLLVVVDDELTTLDVLDEELELAPPEVKRLVADRHSGVSSLRVPLFDWLPEPLRRRGTEFVEASRRTRVRTARPLLPLYLVEDFVGEPEALRFVYRARRPAPPTSAMSELVRVIFPHGTPADLTA